MKKIALTQDKFALVDDDDFEKINKYKWHVRKDRNKWYALRDIGKPGKRKHIHMHRFIMNTPEGMETDHINNDGLDNRKSNLRVCTKNQNMHNAEKRADNTSGMKGVYWHKAAKRWHVRIKVNKKYISLGYFDNIEDAGMEYDYAAVKYFEEFAKTNF